MLVSGLAEEGTAGVCSSIDVFEELDEVFMEDEGDEPLLPGFFASSDLRLFITLRADRETSLPSLENEKPVDSDCFGVVIWLGWSFWPKRRLEAEDELRHLTGVWLLRSLRAS